MQENMVATDEIKKAHCKRISNLSNWKCRINILTDDSNSPEVLMRYLHKMNDLQLIEMFECDKRVTFTCRLGMRPEVLAILSDSYLQTVSKTFYTYFMLLFESEYPDGISYEVSTTRRFRICGNHVRNESIKAEETTTRFFRMQIMEQSFYYDESEKELVFKLSIGFQR